MQSPVASLSALHFPGLRSGIIANSSAGIFFLNCHVSPPRCDSSNCGKKEFVQNPWNLKLSPHGSCFRCLPGPCWGLNRCSWKQNSACWIRAVVTACIQTGGSFACKSMCVHALIRNKDTRGAHSPHPPPTEKFEMQKEPCCCPYINTVGGERRVTEMNQALPHPVFDSRGFV